MLKELSQLLKHHRINLGSITSNFQSPISKCSRLSGLSNTSFRVTFSNPESPQIIIKFYKNLFPQFVDRKLESKVLKLTSKKHLSPKIFALEDWGYIYQYLEGEEINNSQLSTSTLNEITDRLVKFTRCCDNLGKEGLRMRQFENVIQNCKKISTSIESQHSHKIFHSKQLISDLLSDNVIFNISKILPKQTIFSHNDANLTNFIKTQHNQQMLLDYQFSCPNYVGFDLGNLFNELATEYSDKFQIRPQWQISNSNKQRMISRYFSGLQLDLSKKQKLVETGRLLSHHFWFFIGLLSFNDPNCRLDLNYYLKRRHEQFFKYYKELCI